MANRKMTEKKRKAIKAMTQLPPEKQNTLLAFAAGLVASNELAKKPDNQ